MVIFTCDEGYLIIKGNYAKLMEVRYGKTIIR
jgi:hypothetical protein